MALAVGQPAPEFTLQTDAAQPLSLRDLRGKTVVLYFYPKDDTPGCTTEACEFRDLFPRFTGQNVVVLGVSPDSVVSHQKFKAKYQLPFTLLADPDRLAAEAYGVWKHKRMYGRRFLGIERTTVVIDASGNVARVFSKVKARGHAEAVSEAVNAL